MIVSVVIPLYNKAPHIARAIDSVLAQTVQDFEIVVVDDGSTDNGSQIVASYTDPRIHLISQENQGVSAARNRGIAEARSDFLAFLDADDEWGDDHLEVLLRLRRNFPEAGAYSTAYSYVLSIGKITIANFKAIPPFPWEGVLPDYFKAAALGAPPVCASSVAIRKEVFQTLGDFIIGENRGEDLEMWARIALNYDVVFSWEGRCFYHRDVLGSACSKRDIQKVPVEGTFLSFYGSYKAQPYFVRLYQQKQELLMLSDLIYNNCKKKAFLKLICLEFFPSNLPSYARLIIKIIFSVFSRTH